MGILLQAFTLVLHRTPAAVALQGLHLARGDARQGRTKEMLNHQKKLGAGELGIYISELRGKSEPSEAVTRILMKPRTEPTPFLRISELQAQGPLMYRAQIMPRRTLYTRILYKPH